jgi:hypothetical protein
MTVSALRFSDPRTASSPTIPTAAEHPNSIRSSSSRYDYTIISLARPRDQHTMDASNNRLFRFSKPEWLNNNSVRNAGVYTSGALVSLSTHPLLKDDRTDKVNPSFPSGSSSWLMQRHSLIVHEMGQTCMSNLSTGSPAFAQRSECLLSTRSRSRGCTPIAGATVEME